MAPGGNKMSLDRFRTLRHAPSLILAAIIGYQLFIPPSIGLASNGDFAKIIGVFDLGAPAADNYSYVNLTYRFDPQYHWTPGFYSSETLLAMAAIGLNHVFSKHGSFDLRWMGFIHGVLFILAIYLLQPLLADVGRWRRLLLWMAIAVFFGDVMYACYFNTLYMDAAAYVFLMLAVILFLRTVAWQKRSDAVWLVICVALMLLSKSQHAILGLWIAALFAHSGGSLWPGNRWLFTVASTAIVVAATALSVNLSPFDYAARGYYSVIFAQVLPHSKNVKADLEALGLDESYEKLIGTHAYSADSGMNDRAFVRMFMQRTSYSRLAWYFLTHPRDAYLALDRSLAEGGRQRPAMGNFDRRTGLPAYSESQTIAFWSNAKRALFYRHGVRYLSYFVLMALLIVGIATARRRTLPRVLVAGVYAIAAMGISEMLIASLADAVDETRHYFIAGTILDVELLIVLWMLLSGLNDRFHPEAPQQQELRKLIRGKQPHQPASILHQRTAASSHQRQCLG